MKLPIRWLMMAWARQTTEVKVILGILGAMLLAASGYQVTPLLLEELDSVMQVGLGTP